MPSRALLGDRGGGNALAATEAATRQRQKQNNGDADSDRDGGHIEFTWQRRQQWRQRGWNGDGETAATGKVVVIATVAARDSLGGGSGDAIRVE